MQVEARGLIYDATAKPDAEGIAFFTGLCPLRSGAILCSFQVGPSKHAPNATLRLCRAPIENHYRAGRVLRKNCR